MLRSICASKILHNKRCRRLVSKTDYLLQTQATIEMAAHTVKTIDIGVNLTDTMFQGVYGGKAYHPPDLDQVLDRAWAAGSTNGVTQQGPVLCMVYTVHVRDERDLSSTFSGGVDKMIITGGSLEDSRHALQLAKSDSRLYCTVGCHPTRCQEFDSYAGGADGYLQALEALAREGKAAGKCVAIGECGLDYDRLHFCDADTQKRYFPWQLQLAAKLGLPLFLHSRAAAEDFQHIMTAHIDTISGLWQCSGVVHSFDGSMQELQGLLELPNIAIGINGCSLKTVDNLVVSAAIPRDRLMLETDAPWCEIRPAHAGYRFLQEAIEAAPQLALHTTSAKDRKKFDSGCRVKGRNEPQSMMQVGVTGTAQEKARMLPQAMLQVLVVVARQQGLDDWADIEQLAAQVYKNTQRMFFPS